MKKIEIKPNLVDKVVTYFNPVRGQKRFQARAMMALSGGYVGASKSRRSLKSWITGGNDADTDILPDLPTLRERSRDLMRNAPLACGAMSTKVTNVVGTGLKLHARIDNEFLGLTEEEAAAWEANAEREFRLWGNSQECDAERTLNFAGIQSLAFLSTLENGDAFVLLPHIMRKGSPYGLKLQLVEADRVCNKEGKADSDTLSGGVQKDQHGAPVAYHILKGHPGSRYGYKNREWTTVPAFGANTGRRNVLHLYRKRRIGQTRGVPDLAPVIETLKQLDRYTEAEITAAVISGMFTVFVKTEDGSGLAPMDPTSETGGSATDDDFKLSSGAIVDLAENQSIETANPGRPNSAFDPFVMAILRQVGAALELPFEILIKHFTASYSASRAALLEAWRYYMSRREWLADMLCRPVYEAWMTEAVATGRLYAPGFLTDPAVRAAYLGSEWIGPGKGHIQPLQEAKASTERIENGTSTIDKETAELYGYDFGRNHEQRVKETKRRVRDGLEEPKGLPAPETPPDNPDDLDQQDNNEARPKRAFS
jgi:lambda family phage portal protein